MALKVVWFGIQNTIQSGEVSLGLVGCECTGEMFSSLLGLSAIPQMPRAEGEKNNSVDYYVSANLLLFLLMVSLLLLLLLILLSMLSLLLLLLLLGFVSFRFAFDLFVLWLEKFSHFGHLIEFLLRILKRTLTSSHLFCSLEPFGSAEPLNINWYISFTKWSECNPIYNCAICMETTFQLVGSLVTSDVWLTIFWISSLIRTKWLPNDFYTNFIKLQYKINYEILNQ